MKHYFYFKKGQPVPQWLMSVRYTDPEEIANVAQFRTNGKVMVDSTTGGVIMWPASKRMRCIILVANGSRPTKVGFEQEGINHLFTFGPATKEWASGNRSTKFMHPLVRARRCGHNIHTTTKCQPLPERFERVNDKT